MINPPLISIIIPCYNAENSLYKCLESIVQQTYINLEIILIDDGSTDNSFKIYQEFENKDYRITVLKQANSGVSTARNNALKIAKGEYLCFVDADDWVEKNYCSSLFEILSKNNADISIIEAFYEDEFGKTVFNKPIDKEAVLEGKEALSLLLEDNIIQSHPWGKLYKAILFKDIDFPKNLKSFEDFCTLFKVFDKANTVVKSNKKLYHYIQTKNSLSSNSSAETSYYFYQAILEVIDFWENNTFIHNQNKITKNLIKKLLMVLKNILRNTTKEEMLVEKENIRRTFKTFLKYPVSKIGFEYYFFLRLYYYFPTVYTKIITRKR